jgi:hypothetical protein
MEYENKMLYNVYHLASLCNISQSVISLITEIDAKSSSVLAELVLLSTNYGSVFVIFLGTQSNYQI